MLTQCLGNAFPAAENKSVRAAHWLWMAEFGQRTNVGCLITSAHRYSPVTVLPEPGGATMCSWRSPASSCLRAIFTTSACDGRNSPLNCISGNMPGWRRVWHIRIYLGRTQRESNSENSSLTNVVAWLHLRIVQNCFGRYPLCVHENHAHQGVSGGSAVA